MIATVALIAAAVAGSHLSALLCGLCKYASTDDKYTLLSALFFFPGYAANIQLAIRIQLTVIRIAVAAC